MQESNMLEDAQSYETDFGKSSDGGGLIYENQRILIFSHRDLAREK